MGPWKRLLGVGALVLAASVIVRRRKKATVSA